MIVSFLFNRWILLLFDAISEQYFGGGADRWIMCSCWSFVCHEHLLLGVCVTCSYFLLIIFFCKVAKKWLGTHNVTIAIDSITYKKSE